MPHLVGRGSRTVREYAQGGGSAHVCRRIRLIRLPSRLRAGPVFASCRAGTRLGQSLALLTTDSAESFLAFECSSVVREPRSTKDSRFRSLSHVISVAGAVPRVQITFSLCQTSRSKPNSLRRYRRKYSPTQKLRSVSWPRASPVLFGNAKRRTDRRF
jgi:hypothetical protein